MKLKYYNFIFYYQKIFSDVYISIFSIKIVKHFLTLFQKQNSRSSTKIFNKKENISILLKIKAEKTLSCLNLK